MDAETIFDMVLNEYGIYGWPVEDMPDSWYEKMWNYAENADFKDEADAYVQIQDKVEREYYAE